MYDVMPQVGSGGALLGIAGIIIACAFAWLVYQITRFYQIEADKHESYTDTEIVALDEMVKRKHPKVYEMKQLLAAMRKKSFRKRLEDELVDDFFKERDEARTGKTRENKSTKT